jgi:hypothetical protein
MLMIMIMTMVVIFVQRGKFSFTPSGRQPESLSEIIHIQKNINNSSFTVQGYNFVCVCYIYNNTVNNPFGQVIPNSKWCSQVVKVNSTCNFRSHPRHILMSCCAHGVGK